MSRGLNAAAIAFIAALVLGAISSAGVFAAVGISMTPGVEDDTTTVKESLEQNPEVQSKGQDNPVGYTNTAIRIVTVLTVAITNTSKILVILFGPIAEPYADVAEKVFQLAFVTTVLVTLIRGVSPA